MTTLLDPAWDRNLRPYSTNWAFSDVTRITDATTPYSPAGHVEL